MYIYQRKYLLYSLTDKNIIIDDTHVTIVLKMSMLQNNTDVFIILNINLCLHDYSTAQYFKIMEKSKWAMCITGV